MTVRVPRPGVPPRGEFEALRQRAGWTTGETARRLSRASGRRVPEATVRGWDAGLRAPPAEALAWLRAVVGAVEAVPAPEAWARHRRGRTRPGGQDADDAVPPVDKQR